MDFPKNIIESTKELARVMLQFGRTDRVTHHEDGVTLESDTDHTVMLGVMACAFAARYAPHLNIGRIAQFAFIHGLVEVYAMDTNTFKVMTEAECKEKEERERAALVRIKREFDDSYPWISETIEAYEKLEEPEARFVKVFDKILPKLLHILNNGATVRLFGHTRETVIEFQTHQFEKIMRSYGKDQPEVMALYELVCESMKEIQFES